MWVLFDLDGTLTQSEEGIWKSARYTLEKMGYPEPDAATLRKFIGPPLVWSFRELIGMTDAELKTLSDRASVQNIYEMLSTDITDYHRASLIPGESI